MYCPVKIRETRQRCHRVAIAISGRRCYQHIGAQLGFSLTKKQKATLRYLADLAKYKNLPKSVLSPHEEPKDMYVYWSTKGHFKIKRLLQRRTIKCLQDKGLVSYNAEGGWRTATLTQWGRDISKAC